MLTRNIQAQSIYLDCNATAPMDPAVREVVQDWLSNVGNAGSRTHEYGLRARKAVEAARNQVAAVVAASPDEVVFTSGATESNNLAILGLAAFAESNGRRHVVSTMIEHKAVLEPIQALQAKGFEVSLIRPGSDGAVRPEALLAAVREDTLLVSMMQVNNETGVRQPVLAVAEALEGHGTYLHVDAAQGFGKELAALRSPRIDMISISSHKIYGPVGVGALVTRRRRFDKVPLTCLVHGGGQERGLRPGTLPVALIAGFGVASELAAVKAEARKAHCAAVREQALAALRPLRVRIHGTLEGSLPHVLNFSIKGVDSEALMVGLRDLAAVSNGSACTSQSYTPSHVLVAMGLSSSEVAGAVRMSWCHMTPTVDWNAVAARIDSLR
ncbi:MAG: cysteine desulfurase DndA [Bryobacterales bacterium]|nr:cysteine desulfurase DndA [Bryobacterales bacterium]